MQDLKNALDGDRIFHSHFFDDNFDGSHSYLFWILVRGIG
jgi:hypothetical protein